MSTSQCNSTKTITVLKELFAEHMIPEKIRSMDPSLQVTSLLSLQRIETLSTVHLHQGIPRVMDKQSLQSRLLKACLPMPSALDGIHVSLSWHTGVPQLILIYDHLPRCSINVLYVQLCHKGSSIRTPMKQLNMTG